MVVDLRLVDARGSRRHIAVLTASVTVLVRVVTLTARITKSNSIMAIIHVIVCLVVSAPILIRAVVNCRSFLLTVSAV